MKRILDHALYKLDNHLNHVLGFTRNTRGRGSGYHAKNKQKDQTHEDRPAEGVNVKRHESHI